MEFDRSLILRLAEQYDSFYLYDGRMLSSRAAALRSALSGVKLLYSIKANPHPAVLDGVFAEGMGADAASLGEVTLAGEHGLSTRDIYWSAPGKSGRELASAMGKCVVIADSLSELAGIRRIAERRGERISVGIRINPDFTMDGDCGASSKFGIDEKEALEELGRRDGDAQLRVCGIHVHSKSQELCADKIAAYHEKVFALAAKCAERLGRPLDFVNLGSGIGIPYAPHEQEVDIISIGENLRRLKSEYADSLGGAQIMLETGRWAVGKCGVYVTHVIDVKISRGKKYVILGGTLNGFARPSIARMVERCENAAPCEPLYTGRGSVGFIPLTSEDRTETVTLCGNLCTAADVVAEDAELPSMKAGDVLVMTNAGAYSAALTPTAFASFTPPAQLYVSPDERITVI